MPSSLRSRLFRGAPLDEDRDRDLRLELFSLAPDARAVGSLLLDCETCALAREGGGTAVAAGDAETASAAAAAGGVVEALDETFVGVVACVVADVLASSALCRGAGATLCSRAMGCMKATGLMLVLRVIICGIVFVVVVVEEEELCVGVNCFDIFWRIRASPDRNFGPNAASSNGPLSIALSLVAQLYKHPIFLR